MRHLLALVVAAVGLAAGTAYASFNNSMSASMSVTTGQLAVPGTLSASHGTCTLLGSDSVNLSWGATSSTFADGYEIFRSATNGGPYSSIGTVSGRTTTTYNDGGRAFLTTYYYVVEAKRNGWRSANSNQASITTLTNACL